MAYEKWIDVSIDESLYLGDDGTLAVGSDLIFFGASGEGTIRVVHV